MYALTGIAFNFITQQGLFMLTCIQGQARLMCSVVTIVIHTTQRESQVMLCFRTLFQPQSNYSLKSNIYMCVDPPQAKNTSVTTVIEQQTPFIELARFLKSRIQSNEFQSDEDLW